MHESLSTLSRKSYDKDFVSQSIDEVFCRCVIRYPDRIAIKTLDSAITYADLDDVVNQVARSVQGLARARITVGLLMDSGIEICAAILGVLRAGCSYVVLDPGYPADRLQYIAENSDLGIIISAQSQPTDLVVVNDCYQLNWGDIQIADNLPVRTTQVNPTSRAVVLYTSGSTGTPKGVIHSSQTVLFEIWNLTTYWNITCEDKVLLYHSLSFANSLRTFYIALLNGACLLPFDLRQYSFSALASWMRSEKATILRSTPTTFRRFYQSVSADCKLPDLRILSLGGEAISTEDQDIFDRWTSPGATLIHGFGPSEALTSIWHMIPRNTVLPEGKILCGSQTVPGKDVKVVNEKLEELGSGETGQIAVLSNYVALGYENDEEQTQISFIENWSCSGQRLYLTGDTGRYHKNGFLEHVGRQDFQIKLRGFRVDLVEIEFALKSHPAVKHALVIGVDRPRLEKFLVAYIVCSDEQPLIASLRGHLERQLPFYMVPYCFIFIDAIPLTPTGKADRLALPAVDNQRPLMDAPWIRADSQLERKLVDLWGEVLGFEGIGIDDDFFHLGGTSLDCVALIDRLAVLLNIPCELSQLYKCRTPRRLAEHLQNNAKDLPPVFVDTFKSPVGPVLLWIVGGSGDMRSMVIQKLVRGLRDPIATRTFLPANYYAQGEEIDLDDLAARIADDIGAIVSNREFLIGGDCTGALLAWQICGYLQERGLRSKQLILIDPPSVSDGRSETLNTRFEARRNNRRKKQLGHTISVFQNSLRQIFSIQSGETVPLVKRKLRTLLTKGVSDPGLAEKSRRDKSNLAYMQAFKQFSANKCSVDMALLVSDSMRELNVIEYWQALVSGELIVDHVPGDHRGYHSQHIEITTRWLNELLKKHGK
ncbi:MAG: amino acid adenylation domain-containing protein [Parasphingorhabdus sp.]|jgi:amino acid adenylation domain-containing protein